MFANIKQASQTNFPAVEMDGYSLKKLPFDVNANNDLLHAGYKYSAIPLNESGQAISTESFSANDFKTLVKRWKVRMKPPGHLPENAPVMPFIIPEDIACDSETRKAFEGYGSFMGVFYQKQRDGSWIAKRAPDIELPTSFMPLMQEGLSQCYSLMDSDYIQTANSFRKIPCTVKYDHDPFAQLAYMDHKKQVLQEFLKFLAD